MQLTPQKSTCLMLVKGVIFGLLAVCVSSQAEAPSQVKELAGLVMVDAALQVNANVMARTFELVEVSTPTTPSADHAKVWLQARGTKQSLKVIFDDGTIVSLGSN